MNQGIESSQSEFVATLNDDAVACPGWIEALLRAADGPARSRVCIASQVRLQGTGRLDSAGMLIAGDASSKQRGHGEACVDVLAIGGSAISERVGCAISARDARTDLAGSTATSSYTARIRTGAARALGGMAVPLCARCRCGTPVFPLGRPGIGFEGLLRRAEPAVRRREEFPFRMLVMAIRSSR